MELQAVSVPSGEVLGDCFPGGIKVKVCGLAEAFQQTELGFHVPLPG